MTIKDLYGRDPFPSLNSNQGWICPKCGRVYAPGIPSCFACNAAIDTTPSTTPTAPEQPKEVSGDKYTWQEFKDKFFPNMEEEPEPKNPTTVSIEGFPWLGILPPFDHAKSGSFAIADSEAWRWKIYL